MLIRLLLVSSVLFFSFSQGKLKKIKVNENITVSVPQDWRPMDNLDFTERYPSVRAPIAAYTNPDRLADFSINISATRWPDGNVEMAKQFFKASVINMFDRVEMIDEGVREIGGKKLIYFEFESRINGNRTQVGQTDPVLRYSYLQYFIEPGRTLVFSFNCPKREREQWQGVAKNMMKAIRIKA
jgi:hypothetical protein